MNPPTFYGSKVDEDPQEFIDEVYRKIFPMGLSTSDKFEISIYQLNNLGQTWYVKFWEKRPLRGGPVTLDIFKNLFLDRFFPREMRDAKVVEFINLRKGGMSVIEYSLKFTKLSKYSPSFVADPRD